MKTAYICSPFRGLVRRNTAYARRLTRYAVQQGYAPITPHLYITQVLDDEKPTEREQGIAVGLKLLEVCDVILVGCRYGISEGMNAEIEIAKKLDKEIVTLCRM